MLPAVFWMSIAKGGHTGQGQKCFLTLIVACVLYEVILEHAHENGGQKSSQKHHCHAAVDDGEPVYLQDNRVLTTFEIIL